MYRPFMNNNKFIGRFVLWSIGIVCLHFALETLFTLRFDQAFVGLLPDYIAVALLIWGGLQVWKNNAALGLLCGAWSFTLCLHYRAWAWRFEEVMTGSATPLVETTLYVLTYSAPISILSFIITLMLCMPNPQTSAQVK
jgi:hypothetical protein